MIARTTHMQKPNSSNNCALVIVMRGMSGKSSHTKKTGSATANKYSRS